MNALPLAATVLALTASLSAQVLEIPAMTVASTRLVLGEPRPTTPPSALPLGPVTLGTLRNNGNGGTAIAQIAAITLTDSGAGAGFYNVNTGDTLAQFPRNGLARSTTGSGMTIVAPNSSFLPFDATIDMDVRSTQFGLAVGDYQDGMLIEFRNRSDNSLVAAYRSSDYRDEAGLLPKFFDVPAEFDRVVIRADLAVGNWVITELHIAATPAWVPFGAGCPGSNGVPLLEVLSPPALGVTFSLSLSNLPAAAGGYIMTIGSSTESDPAFGPLPLSLTLIGAPGCSVLSSVAETRFVLHDGTVSTTAQFDLPIPNLQALIGAPITNQAFVFDPLAGSVGNTLGFTASNAGVGSIQP
ncbi:MAG: hypothetical protein AB7O97_04660 [Planctomycetota bacterium]